jgi:ribosomal protein S18 acetylase RimI-like enzyme
MARQGLSPVTLRLAVVEDLDTLLALRAATGLMRGRASRLRRPAAAGVWSTASETDLVRTRFGLAVRDPDTRIVLAVSADSVVGFTWLRSASDDGLSGDLVVHIDYLVVSPHARQHGVGMQLLEAALSFAEQQEAESFVIWAEPTDRETNRYLARLGFVQLAVRRGAPLAVVRRKLGQAEHSGAGRVHRATHSIPVLRRPGRTRLEV